MEDNKIKQLRVRFTVKMQSIRKFAQYYNKRIKVFLLFAILVTIFTTLSVIFYSIQSKQAVYNAQAKTLVDICLKDANKTTNTPFCSNIDKVPPNWMKKEPFNLTVAFLGDQSITYDAIDVLKLVKAYSAELIIHQGDLGYSYAASDWEILVNGILGMNFPIVASMGNHDFYKWQNYHEIISRRNSVVKKSDLQCFGCIGVRSVCLYKGLWIYQSSVGVFNLQENIKKFRTFNDTESFEDLLQSEDQILSDEIECAKSHGFPWRITSWHSYSANDPDCGGTDVKKMFKVASRESTMIANGHAHIYRRFYPVFDSPPSESVKEEIFSIMIDGKEYNFTSSESTIVLAKGKSLQVISGLGGIRIDSYLNIFDDMNYGALICKFNPPGLNYRTSNGVEYLELNTPTNILLNFVVCQFITVENVVLDSFTVVLPH